MTFEDLKTHTHVKEILNTTLKEGRVPHAQFFQGTDGGGNLAMAVAYAQELLSGEADMFGGQDQRASRLEHPDLHIVFPMVQSVDKTCDSLVGEFREAYQANPYLSYSSWLNQRDERSKKAIISKHEAESIGKKLTLRSFEGGWKVLLIWMPELMNLDCANKLLKLIEEPPSDSAIIMVGTDMENLLPTIRSRTQLVPFPPLTNQEVYDHLVQNRSEDPALLKEAADIAEGSIGNAIEGLQEEAIGHEKEIMAWLRLCYQRKVPEVMQWTDSIATEGREGVLQMLRETLDIFRSAFLKNHIAGELNSASDLETFTTRFSPFVHDGNVSQLSELVDQAMADVARNGNVRIILLDISFSMMRILRVPKNAETEA